jgi:hypothetical protein
MLKKPVPVGKRFPQGRVTQKVDCARIHNMNARQLFIQDPLSKKIRFTRSGIEQYGEKFGQVGFDIRKIRTMSEFERAVDASFTHDMQQLAATTKGQNIDLDQVLTGLPGWD